MATNSPHLAALGAEVAQLAEAAAASAVAVEHQRRLQSGFYWKPDVVATVSEGLEARHGDIVTVHTGSEHVQATVIGRDPSTDLVLLRVPSGGMPLPVATTAPGLGHAVVVVGRSQHGPVLSFGFIALAGAPWRSMRGGDIGRRLWLDARVPRSAEGGIVLDNAGGLIGMAVFGPRRRVIVIPAETIDRAGNELLTHGKIRQGYLGVSVHPVELPSTDAGKRGIGLMVVNLDPNGPAHAAGILRGDIITAVDAASPQSARSLSRLLPSSAIGQPKSVDLIRAGTPTQLAVTIGEQPNQ